jgi:hypothetical protein
MTLSPRFAFERREVLLHRVVCAEKTLKECEVCVSILKHDLRLAGLHDVAAFSCLNINTVLFSIFLYADLPHTLQYSRCFLGEKTGSAAPCVIDKSFFHRLGMLGIMLYSSHN